MNIKSRTIFVSMMLTMILFSGCSLKKNATTMTADIIGEGMTAVESESDLWIMDQSIIPMVKILEVFRAADPTNKRFSGLMSKVYGNVAFGFFEPKFMTAKAQEKEVWKARVKRYYELGYNSGEVFLKRRFGDDVTRSIALFQKQVSSAGKKDLSPMFWTAFNLGQLVNMNKGDISAIANLPKVTALVEKILELDRNFAYGSALALDAVMLASRPSMLGGNPERAKELFEEAVKVTDGKYLMNKVMFAEWYAIPQKDMLLANELLNSVIKSDPLALPEQALANNLAIERARILLSGI